MKHEKRDSAICSLTIVLGYIYTDWNTKTVLSIEADILWDCTNLSHHLISSPKYWRLTENLTTLLSIFFLDWEGVHNSTRKQSTQSFS